MTLPDFTSQIFTYLNALLNWGPIVMLLAVMAAGAGAAVVVSLFMRAFMRS